MVIQATCLCKWRVLCRPYCLPDLCRRHPVALPPGWQAEEDARRAEEEAAAALAAVEAGTKVEVGVAVSALQQALASGGLEGVSPLLGKLSVEGGAAAKARAVWEALFGGLGAEDKLAAKVKEALPLLASIAGDARGQLAQLVAFEWLLAVGAPERQKEGALVLKVLYDGDLVDEDLVLGWADKEDAAKVLGVEAGGAAAVREAVSKVVEWLREEDSEEEDEE
jgi:translation initiation factor 5